MLCCCRYEADMWTEVAKYLFGAELVRLSSTCRWFRRLLADEFIWRHAFLRDLSLLPAAADRYPPRPLHRSWRLLYAAAFSKLLPSLPPSTDDPVPLTDMTRVPSLLPPDGAHSYWFRRSSRHIGKRSATTSSKSFDLSPLRFF